MTIPHLDRFPAVGEDEPWIAAAPVKLAREGVLGNDLFSGYYSMELHHLQHMPVYPLVEAGVFKLFGVGVWQMRALSVAFGLALIVAVFLAGAQTGDARVGLVGVAVLLLLKIVGADQSGTGILLLDRARVNRYDIAVPVFGLAALWVFNRARISGRGVEFFSAGILAGLSTLSHLYGIFWIIVLLVLACVYCVGRRPHAAVLIAVGFALACAPWALFIARHWTDYVGQMRPSGGRFHLFDAAFYARNALTADGPISIGWAIRSVAALPLVRIGTWTMLFGLVLSAGIAVTTSVRRSLPVAEAVLLTAAAIQLLLFGSLLAVKTMAYMVALWPLGALVLGWGVIRAWSASRIAVRALIVVVLAAAFAEGAVAIAASRASVDRASSYGFYTDHVARCIPRDQRVLGFQHYWLGLRQFEYRTWLLPINMSRPGWYDEELTLKQALERVDPGVVLIDRFMSNYLRDTAASDHPYHRDAADVAAFMAERGATLTCSVSDRTYGTMLVYTLTR